MSVVEPCLAVTQNFLRNPCLIERLLNQSSIGPDDLVIEIGPGRGAITERLAHHCRQVLAVEMDDRLGQHLQTRFAGSSNVAVFAGDFLQFPLPLTPFKVFASIPFNVTTAIVGKLTSGTSPPADTYLVVQREAAERFAGTPRATLVSTLLRPWFEPAVVHQFRRTDFEPVPRVEIVMLRLRRRASPLITPADAQPFRDLVTAVFTAWRPTVGEALRALLSPRTAARIERRVGHDLHQPPAALPFAAWLEVAAALDGAANERYRQAIAGAEARLRHQQATLTKAHRSRSVTHRGPRGKHPGRERGTLSPSSSPATDSRRRSAKERT